MESEAMGGCGSKAEEEPPGLPDRSSWMRDLPEEIRKRPLAELKIPGSHDSLTSELSDKLPIANDQPKWLQDLDNPGTRKVVLGWSTTQSLGLTAQLDAGVRYLDLRVSRPAKPPHDFRIVHGLYGPLVEPALVELSGWLSAHPGEVVLVDVNHFYGMDATAHSELRSLLGASLGGLLAPFVGLAGLSGLSLDSLAKAGHQAIAFYHQQDAEKGEGAKLWPGSLVPSPWADTDKQKALMDFLAESLGKREMGQSFWVSQGILTPRLQDVMARPCSTLKTSLAIPTTRVLVNFLNNFPEDLLPKLNVVIADYVDSSGFIEAVIKLNQTSA